MNWKRVTYVIFPFLLIGLLLFITYFGNQWYAETFGNPGVDYSYIFLKFNQMVPFWDWTIYPYIIAYPVWGFSVFLIGYYSKKNFYNILGVVVITFSVCGIWYFLFQSDVEAWRLTSGLFLNNDYLTPRTDLNFTESLLMMIYMAAGPRNAIPSMHTLNSWIAIIGIRMDKKIPKGWVIFTWVLNLAIIISTQTTKQHYVIDAIIALALAEMVYWLIRDSKFTRWLESIFTKLNTKYHLDWDGIIR